MEQLITLFLKNGLKPLVIDQEINEIAKKVTRSELIALIMLKQRGQSTTSQLATDMGIPLSTVTNISQRLSRRGFIKRERDITDKRVILLKLNSTGEELSRQVLEIMNSVIQKIKDGLTPEELEQFIILLLKVVKIIQTNQQEEKKEETTFRCIKIEE